MKFLTRNLQVPRIRRSTARARGQERRPPRSFETLETRLLLSDATATPRPISSVQVQTTSFQSLNQTPKLLTSSINPAGPSPLAVDALSLHDDSFVLEPGQDVPSVRVDLLFSTDPTAEDDHLLVSSASGQLLYNLNLNDVESLHADLLIPSTQSTPANLGIDLVISRPGVVKSSPGTYQVAIYWNGLAPVGDPLPQPTPLLGNSLGTTFSSILSHSVDPPAPSVPFAPPADPWLRIKENLPAIMPTSQNQAGPVTKSGGVSLPVNAPSPAPARSAPVALDEPSTSQLPSRTGRVANVGPLPLSAPTSDGGIFAYPGPASRSSDQAFEPTTTLEPATTPATEALAGPIFSFLGGVVRQVRSSSRLPRRPMAPVVVRPDLQRSSEPFPSSDWSLPPLADLANPTQDEQRVRHEVAAAPIVEPAISRGIRFAPSITVALIVSFGLIFGLVIPDCVTMLAAYRLNSRKRVAIEPS